MLLFNARAGIKAFMFPMLGRHHLCSRSNQQLRTLWGSWLLSLMAWDTGASSRTVLRTYLRFSVSFQFCLFTNIVFTITCTVFTKCLYFILFYVRPTATLDSAVTAGSHGAKNFLMRDEKEVVQCVFYENVSKKNTSSLIGKGDIQ